VRLGFIASTTTLYAPTVTATEVDLPFISSTTTLYPLTLKKTFTGSGVSQVSVEVLATTTAQANVSQVVVEVLMPRSGMHINTKV
jgi:hypothetical protein